jgi:hypothetical protein
MNLHFADIRQAMVKVLSFTEGHDAFEIELHVKSGSNKKIPRRQMEDGP